LAFKREEKFSFNMLVICTALKFEENISDEKETETEIERLEKKFLNRD
jgi:hypothetical protein